MNKTKEEIKLSGDLEFKNLFLEKIKKDYKEATYKQYKQALKKISIIEMKFEKDLYDFNSYEMIEALKSFKAKTYNAITSRYSLIKKYIEYANSKNLGTNIILKNRIIDANQLRECIDVIGNENRYCTRQELEKAVENLLNPCDKAMFLLLFEGVMGKEYYDLLNLKVEQINLDTRVIHLKNKDITFSKGTEIEIRMTINQDEYHKYIEDDLNYRGNESYSLNMQSPYFLKKKMMVTVDNYTPLSQNGIKTRLDSIKDYMDKSLLTGKTIYLSGVAEKIVKEELKLGHVFKIQEIENYLGTHKEKIEVGDMHRILKQLRERILKEVIS